MHPSPATDVFADKAAAALSSFSEELSPISFSAVTTTADLVD